MPEARTERPRICTIDVDETICKSLESHGYNLFAGTFGNIIRVPNKKRYDQVVISLDYDVPENLHEFDLLILDLTNEKTTDYQPKSDKGLQTKSRQLHRLVCSYPTTIFDPRPLGATLIGNEIAKINNRKFLQIIFACGAYEFEYETQKV